MTVKEMSQLHYLNKEIEQLKKQKSDLEYVLNDMSFTMAGVQGSDANFPYVLHNIKVAGIATGDRNKWLQRKAELEDIKSLIELNGIKLTFEYNRLNRYIQECEDSLIRQVLSLRYINGLSWEQVADSIGGGNTGNSVKMIAYRYLNKN